MRFGDCLFEGHAGEGGSVEESPAFLIVDEGADCDSWNCGGRVVGRLRPAEIGAAPAGVGDIDTDVCTFDFGGDVFCVFVECSLAG